MRRYGLLGDPVSHSLSPVMFRAAFDHLGLGAVYETIRVPAGHSAGLAEAMRRLAETGGGNVTVPHKEQAARIADRLLPAGQAAGACNCFWLDGDGRLTGDNTDVDGFLASVRELAGFAMEGARVLLLGAGGGARAVALACAGDGASWIEVRNREPTRARSLIEALGLETVARARRLSAPVEGTFDLVVNATPLGMAPDDPLPLDLSTLSVAYAVDLVYGRDGTRWTGHARALGITALDGLPMLVHQGVLCLERWLGGADLGPGLRERMLSALRLPGGSRPASDA